MKKTIKVLQPNMLLWLAEQTPNIFVREDFAFLNGIGPGMTSYIRNMIYAEFGRVVRVTAGRVVYRINLIPVTVQAGDVVIVPENTYIEVCEVTEDFDLQIVSFRNLPVSFTRPTHLRLDVADFSRTGDYLELVWQVIHKPAFSMQTVIHLLSALMNDLQHLHRQDEQTKRLLTHSEQLMQQFVDLVAEYGATERRVQFYAERMLLTPNYLSAFVRKHSAKSVMEWLNERTVLQAKVLLRHSDMAVGDIAFRLGFTEATLFSRFFRRETGLSPTEYRSVQ